MQFCVSTELNFNHSRNNTNEKINQLVFEKTTLPPKPTIQLSSTWTFLDSWEITDVDTTEELTSFFFFFLKRAENEILSRVCLLRISPLICPSNCVPEIQCLADYEWKWLEFFKKGKLNKICTNSLIHCSVSQVEEFCKFCDTFDLYAINK